MITRAAREEKKREILSEQFLGGVLHNLLDPAGQLCGCPNCRQMNTIGRKTRVANGYPEFSKKASDFFWVSIKERSDGFRGSLPEEKTKI